MRRVWFQVGSIFLEHLALVEVPKYQERIGALFNQLASPPLDGGVALQVVPPRARADACH
ncbi:MAG: hypothetical protein JWR44_3437 [Hymenobacter sp.]|nr:hypothetical protein [Hymenobacter sp.]